MMALAEFKRRYNGAVIVTVPDSSLTVGQKVEWRMPGQLHFEAEPILITDKIKGVSQDVKTLFTAISTLPPKNADFAHMSISSFLKLKGSTFLPTANTNVSLGIVFKKSSSFYFEGVKARVVDINTGTPFIHALEHIKNHDKKEWNRIKGYRFIEKLYYASEVKIGVKKMFKKDIDAELAKAGVKVAAETQSDSFFFLHIKGKQDVPFAARIETIRDWVK